MVINAKYVPGYLQQFSAMRIKPERVSEVDRIVNRINTGRSRYEGIEKATGVPWFFIGVIHYMEAGCDFSRHLHNGDPLTAKTVNVPAGRPASGKAPFTWEESALDAIRFKSLHNVKDWSVPAMLYVLEAFNGFGYRRASINIPSPYLWSFSNLYSKGKFVRDGVYDPNTVSKQAGAAVILKRVMERNNLLTTAIVSGGVVGLVLAAALFFF